MKLHIEARSGINSARPLCVLANIDLDLPEDTPIMEIITGLLIACQEGNGTTYFDGYKHPEEVI